MYLKREERDYIIREITHELRGKLDGSRKNLLVPVCPVCGKGGSKFGIYLGEDTEKKRTFMSHCFKCGATTRTLNELLDLIGRDDLKIEQRATFEPLDIPTFYQINNEEEIDDELSAIQMPQGWKRCFKNPYLRRRGFEADDYEYFPVGTTRGLNFKFDEYVVFPIIDNGEYVGYVSRHTWPKDDLDSYNQKARRSGKFEKRRYNNSVENNFVKLLYNYDSVIEDKTDTVILCEGIFDVIALTRKLDLYDNPTIVPVATFGKKISQVQTYKLQTKGVRNIVIGYDTDARGAILKTADNLKDYFETCLIANLQGNGKDWDEMDFWEIYDTFSVGLMTPREYKLKTVQI